jgi:hypothetical protein
MISFLENLIHILLVPLGIIIAIWVIVAVYVIFRDLFMLFTNKDD